MKQRLRILFLAILFSNSYHVLGHNTHKVPIHTEWNFVHCSMESGLIVSKILRYPANPNYSCTRSIKVRILTEAGIIGIGLSITAGNCQQADAGISEALRGFIKGIY